MIIGDIMTDAYVFGKVDRISPEAPVPVVHITHREMRPGGAANVAINIKALGAQPILCSVTGDDDGGNEFIELLNKENISAKGIIKIKGRKTTIKTRVIGNNHQLLRVDDETIEDLNSAAEQTFIQLCISLIEKENPDVLIFEDYDKGVLTPAVIESITNHALSRKIPITVDPKKKYFNNYKNVTLFKPNLHELKSGLNVTIDKITTANLRSAVNELIVARNIQMVMVTLSEAGVFIASENEAMIIPAHVRNISDVSGAGDTVISVASLCVPLDLPKETIAGLSNLAGGLVCEQVGVVPINKIQLLEEVEKFLH
ncbi:MAG: D-glycero-beta-D-manno-heptose-7-phosphate kinase [Bacteroidetes bacterium]|nr:D-glycero-beta-D-manno-heptose-7-phosphate kinase [Bacteroidota bacterium]